MSLTSHRAPREYPDGATVTVQVSAPDRVVVAGSPDGSRILVSSGDATASLERLHAALVPAPAPAFDPLDVKLGGDRLRGRGEAPPGTPRDGLEPNDLDDHSMLAGTDDATGVAGLETIDLLGETVRLFRQTKRMLSKVLVDQKTPINQQAQVISTLGSLLKALSQQQTDIYNAERLKRLESITIRLVRDLAPELQDRFMADYEREVNLRPDA